MPRPKDSTAPLFAPQPPEQRSPFWWMRYIPAVILVIILLDFIYIVGSVALVPVLASFALAYLLNPLVNRAVNRGMSRPVATLTAMAVVLLIGTAILMFIIPTLWTESIETGQKLLSYLTPDNARRVRGTLRHISPMLDRIIGRPVEQFFNDPAQALGSGEVLAGGLTGFLSTAAASLDLLLVPFFVYYILVDFGKWRDSLEEIIPPRFRDTFSRLFDEVGRILEAYVRGQLLIAMVMGLLYAVGFVALGVPAGPGIALLSGFLNTIPYVGTMLGLLLASAFTLSEGGGLWRVAGIVGVFTAVQSIEGYFLTPRILGTRLSLHPMAVFLGILIGGKLFGLLGIILAVPTIAVAKVFMKFLQEIYKGSHFYHNGEVSPADAPNENLEERLADAADAVLAEQVGEETGEELLAPDEAEDDRIAREGLKKT